MKRKGFTLVELMVVVLIVAILAAVTVPILRGRIESAKWSEGKAAMGTIATAIKAMYAETGGDGTLGTALAVGADNTLTDLGFNASATHDDFKGKYFNYTNYSYDIDKFDTEGLEFTITCDTATGTKNTGAPDGAYTLDQAGKLEPVAADG